jgi:hypothetical protein
MLRSNKSKPVKKFGSFTGVDFEKWFLATSGGGYCKRERESCLQKREREGCLQKRESEVAVVFSDLWRRS